VNLGERWLELSKPLISTSLYLQFCSSVGGIIEMKAFQMNFPTIFPEDVANDTDHSCSLGGGGVQDFLVVNKN